MLREVQEGDALGICHLYNPYILNTVITFEEEPLQASDINDRIEAVKRSGLPWLVSIEAQSGAIQGYAYASPWRTRSAFRYSVETSIYIDPRWQKQGLGQHLYQSLLDRLQTQGIHTAIAVLALPNPASIRLHEKLGFQWVGELPEVGFKFDRWVDVAYWQICLEKLKTRLAEYHKTIEKLLMKYAETKPAYGEIKVEPIFDTVRNHYQIMHLGWKNKRWIHHCVVHLGIRNEKIWIFHNSTEHDVAADLVSMGIGKQDIVLAFHSPAMRAMSEYAVE